MATKQKRVQPPDFAQTIIDLTHRMEDWNNDMARAMSDLKYRSSQLSKELTAVLPAYRIHGHSLPTEILNRFQAALKFGMSDMDERIQ